MQKHCKFACDLLRFCIYPKGGKPFFPFLRYVFASDTINELQRKIHLSLLKMQELLVSLKHVLGTDFKRGLFPLIDTLLDERYEAYEAHLSFDSFVFFKKLFLSNRAQLFFAYNLSTRSIFKQIMTF